VTIVTETSRGTPNVRKIDRVIAAVLLIFLALAFLAPGQVFHSFQFITKALAGISIFLAVSVLAASFAKATGLDQQITLVFSGRPMQAILLASLFGALSPFCSCGVVPIIAGLLIAGVPLAPVMAFCLASPLMDPSMFLLMLPIFGLEFTVAKLIFAVLIGATAGIALHCIKNRIWLRDPLRVMKNTCSSSNCRTDNPLEKKLIVLDFWRDSGRLTMFWKEGLSSGWFLTRWLTLAFLLESLMIAYIPAQNIALLLGADAWWAIPASVILGVPAYLNGYAAIPTISGLMELGMIPGAAMGFIIAGGVSSIPAAMAVFALVKKPVFLMYILWGLGGSMVAAYIFQFYQIIIAL
tara:strand:- start:2553 stop:3608 length:1056 start_codon:yes stop_codon:yes gene_type:complete